MAAADAGAAQAGRQCAISGWLAVRLLASVSLISLALLSSHPGHKYLFLYIWATLAFPCRFESC
jgi:hypothetical protein